MIRLLFSPRRCLQIQRGGWYSGSSGAHGAEEVEVPSEAERLRVAVLSEAERLRVAAVQRHVRLEYYHWAWDPT